MDVPVVMDVVGCHGSTGNYLYIPVDDGFEVWICKSSPYSNEDIAVEKIESFVN